MFYHLSPQNKGNLEWVDNDLCLFYWWIQYIFIGYKSHTLNMGSCNRQDQAKGKGNASHFLLIFGRSFVLPDRPFLYPFIISLCINAKIYDASSFQAIEKSLIRPWNLTLMFANSSLVFPSKISAVLIFTIQSTQLKNKHFDGKTHTDINMDIELMGIQAGNS